MRKIQGDQIAQKYLGLLKSRCYESTSAILKEKIPPCMESLLAIDTLSHTKTTCVSITVRTCKDRVKQWIDSHVNISIFSKDFGVELQKMHANKKSLKGKPLFALLSIGNRDSHIEDCLSAAHLLEAIQVRLLFFYVVAIRFGLTGLATSSSHSSPYLT